MRTLDVSIHASCWMEDRPVFVRKAMKSWMSPLVLTLMSVTWIMEAVIRNVSTSQEPTLVNAETVFKVMDRGAWMSMSVLPIMVMDLVKTPAQTMKVDSNALAKDFRAQSWLKTGRTAKR